MASSPRDNPQKTTAAAAAAGKSTPAKRVSVTDVAAEAGVTIASVSRALNGAKHVSPELRAKVRLAAEKLGYTPNPAARGLRLGRTGTVGCMVRDVAHPMYGAVVSSVERELTAHGHTLLLANSYGNRQREAEILSLFQRSAMDGAIVTSSSPWSDPGTHPLANAGLPLVMLDRDEPLSADRVCVGHRAGMRTAVDYLLSLGHRRIALFTPGLNLRPGRERVAGYAEAHQAAGLSVDRLLIPELSSPTQDGHATMAALLSTTEAPTALIALGTRMLSGALRAVRERGLQVPSDFSVIAIGTQEMLELAQPTLTCLRMDLDGLGRQAAQLMLARLAAPGETLAPQRIDLPTELVIGASCGPAMQMAPTRQRRPRR